MPTKKRKAEPESELEEFSPPKPRTRTSLSGATATATAAQPRPQTLRQAKAAYKKQSSSRLSEKEMRQIQRRAELEARAARIRAAEERKEKNRRKREEKEKKERELLKNGQGKGKNGMNAGELGKFFGRLRDGGKENVFPAAAAAEKGEVVAEEVQRMSGNDDDEEGVKTMMEPPSAMMAVNNSSYGVMNGDEYGDWDLPSNSQVEKEISGICTSPILKKHPPSTPPPARPDLVPANTSELSPSPSPLSLLPRRSTEENVRAQARSPSTRAHAPLALTVTTRAATAAASSQLSAMKATTTSSMPPPPPPSPPPPPPVAEVQARPTSAKAPPTSVSARRQPLQVQNPSINNAKQPSLPAPAAIAIPPLKQPKPPPLTKAEFTPHYTFEAYVPKTKPKTISSSSSLTASQQESLSLIPPPSTQDLELTAEDLEEICGPCLALQGRGD